MRIVLDSDQNPNSPTWKAVYQACLTFRFWDLIRMDSAGKDQIPERLLIGDESPYAEYSNPWKFPKGIRLITLYKGIFGCPIAELQNLLITPLEITSWKKSLKCWEIVLRSNYSLSFVNQPKELDHSATSPDLMVSLLIKKTKSKKPTRSALYYSMSTHFCSNLLHLNGTSPDFSLD